jgi:glycosyltransferase involved in cell wall biosynthesis
MYPKVALVAPLYEAVPPKLYGGTERVVANLANALVELGLDVTLFAAADAETRARLIPVRDQAIRLDDYPLKSDLASHLNLLHEVRRRAHLFDVVHFHIDLLHFPLFTDIADRTVTTLHGRLDLKDLPRAYELWPDYPMVSISDNQASYLPFANWLGTVHHGVPQSRYRPPTRPSGDYLAFLGRISPEKRPDRAIAIAKRAGLPLKIAAKVDPVDRPYYSEVIKPLMDHPLIEYVGEIGDGDKSEFLGNALALLFPIDWPEPFGLVMIEAMACATPVIAWNCGAAPEVVENDLTGWIVSSEAQALAAVRRAAGLDRARIRQEFERRFTSACMAANYLKLYRRVAGAISPIAALKAAG